MDMISVESRILSLKEKVRASDEERIRLQEQSRVAKLKESEALAQLDVQYGVSSLEEAKALLTSKFRALDDTLAELEGQFAYA